MELTPDRLTEAEARQLRGAISQGKLIDSDVPKWQSEERQKLNRLKSVWSKLDDEERDTLIELIAAKHNCDATNYNAFDDAIQERLELVEFRRAPTVPGLVEAVETLRRIWVSRGNKTGGNAHRSRREGKPEHTMHIFIAEHALAQLPEIGDGAAGTEQQLHNAIRRVESQLRNLRDLTSIYRE